MPRKRTIRIIDLVPEKGPFGICNCGGTIRFYSDCGVRCDKCNQLHATWNYKKEIQEGKVPTNPTVLS